MADPCCHYATVEMAALANEFAYAISQAPIALHLLHSDPLLSAGVILLLPTDDGRRLYLTMAEQREKPTWPVKKNAGLRTGRGE